MPKRTSDVAALPNNKAAAVGQSTARPAEVEDEEMGEFEDRWEDEIEEEEVYDAQDENGDDEGE